MFDCPLLDLARIAIGATVVLAAITDALMEPLLIITLELLVQDDPTDPRAALFRVLGFSFSAIVVALGGHR